MANTVTAAITTPKEVDTAKAAAPISLMVDNYGGGNGDGNFGGFGGNGKGFNWNADPAQALSGQIVGLADALKKKAEGEKLMSGITAFVNGTMAPNAGQAAPGSREKKNSKNQQETNGKEGA